MDLKKIASHIAQDSEQSAKSVLLQSILEVLSNQRDWVIPINGRDVMVKVRGNRVVAYVYDDQDEEEIWAEISLT